MKRPAFQFYPADWRKDLELQSCSIGARGLWHEMMCLMHEADPYGFLFLNSKPMTNVQAATACRVTPGSYKTLLAELIAAGVPGVREGDGAIFSRRMVRDEEDREVRAETGRANGAKGAEFGKLGGKHGQKGGRPRKTKNPDDTGDENPDTEPGRKPPYNPRPSSSSSSSTSVLKTKGADAPTVYPSWAEGNTRILDAWRAFVQMRKAKRQILTPLAVERLWKRIDAWHQVGYDVADIMLKSVDCGYTDLYEPKEKRGPAAAQQSRAVQEWLDRDTQPIEGKVSHE